MRITVRQHLEARLTSAESQAIIDQVMLKRFLSGAFAGGLEAGVDTIELGLR